MLCGKNTQIEGIKDLQDQIAQASKGGKDALAELESALGSLQGEIEGFVSQVDEKLSSLQEDIAAAIGDISSPTAFTQAIAEIKKKYGEAVDDFDKLLSDLGLTSFPPTLDLAALCEKIPNIKADADGNTKEVAATSKVPSAPPIPQAPKVVVDNPLKSKATRDLAMSVRLYKARLKQESSSMQEFRAKWASDQVHIIAYNAELLGLTLDGYIGWFNTTVIFNKAQRDAVFKSSEVTRVSEKFKVIYEEAKIYDLTYDESIKIVKAPLPDQAPLTQNPNAERIAAIDKRVAELNEHIAGVEDGIAALDADRSQDPTGQLWLYFQQGLATLKNRRTQLLNEKQKLLA